MRSEFLDVNGVKYPVNIYFEQRDRPSVSIGRLPSLRCLSKCSLRILSMPLGRLGKMPPGLFLPFTLSIQKQRGHSLKRLSELGERVMGSPGCIGLRRIKDKIMN